MSFSNNLRGYIPTGSLSLHELQNKMSLYLLGQLLHGITLVYEFQAIALCRMFSKKILVILYKIKVLFLILIVFILEFVTFCFL